MKTVIRKQIRTKDNNVSDKYGTMGMVVTMYDQPHKDLGSMKVLAIAAMSYTDNTTSDSVPLQSTSPSPPPGRVRREPQKQTRGWVRFKVLLLAELVLFRVLGPGFRENGFSTLMCCLRDLGLGLCFEGGFRMMSFISGMQSMKV